MTITQLEYVVAVATYKSFVAAAEKCYVTQPTLSMQIQKLEDELDIKLFDRNKHPIEVTEMGVAIVNQAKTILAEAQKVHDLIQQQKNVLAGTFKLAVIPTVAPYILPYLLSAYGAAYPDVRLEVTEMETNKILQALRNNEIDAGLLSGPLEENGIKEYPLFFEPFVAYFAPGEKALEKRMISPEDVDIERIWFLSEGHCMRNQIINLCSEQIRKVQASKLFQYESSNVETLRKMVDINGGLTILPELATSDFSDDQIEMVRYFEAPEPVREISLATNGHFVRSMLLQSLSDEILKLVPEKMRVQKKTRKVLRIQSAKL